MLWQVAVIAGNVIDDHCVDMSQLLKVMVWQVMGLTVSFVTSWFLADHGYGRPWFWKVMIMVGHVYYRLLLWQVMVMAGHGYGRSWLWQVMVGHDFCIKWL